MPNAGKSSLFNALTKAGAEAANYPFTTIEPNVAVVPVRDERLEEVARPWARRRSCGTRSTSTTSPAWWPARTRARGSATASWRTSARRDAIVHVVRAHGDENVIHPEGRVDPLADIETIETELMLADLEQAERRVERVAQTGAQAATASPIAEEAWLREVIAALQAGAPGAHGARARGRAERGPRPGLADEPSRCCSWPTWTRARRRCRRQIAEHAAAQGARAVAVSSRIESELAELDDEDASAMREELGGQRVRPPAGRARGVRAAAS